jgi:transcriptional activator of cad operon
MLNLLEISGKDESRRSDLVNRIFEISGASTVVDLELSGAVNDYRLVYHLFTRTDQSSGIIIEHELDSLVEALAKIIAAKTESHLDLAHLDTQFNSELVARAVEKWNMGQGDAAISLLHTGVAIKPNDFLAHQLLIEYLIQQQRWLQAAKTAKAIIDSAQIQHFPRAYIFYFLLAQVEVERGELQVAHQHLGKAQLLAEAAFDLVYQGYIATLQGDLALKENKHMLAEAAYQRAIGNHQSIACPLGVSLVRLKLIELYSLQHKNALAIKELALVNALIRRHKLPLQTPSIPLI